MTYNCTLCSFMLVEDSVFLLSGVGRRGGRGGGGGVRGSALVTGGCGMHKQAGMNILVNIVIFVNITYLTLLSVFSQSFDLPYINSPQNTQGQMPAHTMLSVFAR